MQAKADMSTDAGLAPAREFMQQAVDGWAAVQQGQKAPLPLWKAMHGVLGGAVPAGEEPLNEKRKKRVRRG